MLKPFWRYYGGKYRAAPKYPAPICDTIVEPFAGAAGYSLRHYTKRVILVDKYPAIAGIWRYLIAATAEEILRLPLVDAVDDLPSWVPQEARNLIGFWLNEASTTPGRTLSAGMRRQAERGNTMSGWVERSRERVASQVPHIKHWSVACGSYDEIPNEPATYFVDPPYNNKAGSHYKHGPDAIDFEHIAEWCRTRKGQVIACENDGADWLPFRFLAHTKAMQSGKRGGKRTSAEVIWHAVHGVQC
jgi:site-specific DNA-adenine methylase